MHVLDKPPGGKGKKEKREKKQRRATEDSVESVGGGSRGSSRAGWGGTGAGHLNKLVRRRRRTAIRQMTSLGGSFATKDAEMVKEIRKLRGECGICGQKCYHMTVFKAIPLNIPEMVQEGRCLLCT